MEVKKCTNCGRFKELSEFGKFSRAKDGFKPMCKKCRNKKAKITRLKEKIKTNEEDLELTIKNTVCKELNVKKEQLNVRSRNPKVVLARIITSYILWKNFGDGSNKIKKMSLGKIGEIVRHNNDHSAINYYLGKANDYIDTDPSFLLLLQSIEKVIVELRLNLLYVDLVYSVGDFAVTYSNNKEPIKVDLLTYDFIKGHWICNHNNTLFCRKEHELVTLNK